MIIANDAFSLLNFRAPLIRAVLARGWRVTALAPNFSDDQRRILTDMDVAAEDYPLNRTGMNPIADIGTVLALARILRRLKADRVFSFAIKPVIYGLMAARLAGNVHAYGLVAGLGYAFSDKGGPRQKAVRWLTSGLARIAMNGAQRVFFQNRDDLDDLVRWNVIRREKGLVVGATGVHLAEWPVAPFPEGEAVFLLAARLVREKGIVEFAEAARRIKADYPEARFVLLGGLDSNPNALARETIEGWSHIEWAGHVSNVREWLARCTVFVLPSYYREGVPRSTQEAMALGRPVVTTDWPGCRETVVDERNGFLIPVRDDRALEAAMRRFIDDPVLAERMGAESRRMVLERFDAARINAGLLEAMDIA
ncbi:MAG: glycosyltransferase family 4 protein [Devosia sp.]|uniref:glycosyltransferase family 4 protein n=1 Tax=Devosia sp. TaxID=1871048 RepID=UPI0024CABA48|nr:glycosyltransferase family 4 protein [Devosia sp.]UYO00432.1 MAG: glycosyltransferase family 4 protein [Devosia sp.]